MNAPDLSPADAARRWLNKRSVTLADQTLYDYHYRLKVFTDWAAEQGIDSMKELTPWLVDEFDAKRKGDDLAAVSLKNHQKTVKDWLAWASEVGIAPEGVAAAIEVPDVDREDHVSKIRLRQESAEQLIETYRNGRFRASSEHVTFEILWFVGCRMGGLRALDLGDVDRAADVLELRHRPESDTPLKNGKQGERDVGVPEETMEVISEYIGQNRPDSRDDHGRMPLLATVFGRISQSQLRNWCYFATLPCRFQECPHGKDRPSCDWFKKKDSVHCPSSRSPHQVRSGSITWQLNRGLDVNVVARRVNASVRVIDTHYDLPSKREEFEERGREHLGKLVFETEENA